MLPNGGRDHLRVDLFDLRNSLDDQRSDIIEDFLTIDWVSGENDVLDFGQLRKLSDLIPRLDTIVAHEEGVQFDAWVQTLQLLDLVVGDPELLKGLTDLIESDNSLDVVSTERKNFQILKFWQVDDSLNCVRGETELLTILKLVEGIVHLIDKWDLAEEGDLLGLCGDCVVLSLPILDSVSARCCFTHI